MINLDKKYAIFVKCFIEHIARRFLFGEENMFLRLVSFYKLLVTVKIIQNK